MRILETYKGVNYKQIRVEKSFLFWKWETVYRQYNNKTILRYVSPDKYINVGISEYIDITNLFSTF